MKLLLFLFLISSQAFSESCDHTPDRFNCVKYIRAYDGDTITFELPNIHPFFGKRAKVRLLGIDAPELRPKGQGQPCETIWGRVAKRQVEAELRSAQRIDITGLTKHDKFGRILGDVVYDGKHLRDVLLKNHLAVEYLGKSKTKVNWCEKKAMRENFYERKKLKID